MRRAGGRGTGSGRWSTGCSGRRACRSAASQNLVRIARRVEDLPRCWALFSEGQLTEDVMARLARRLPAERDAELAVLVPDLMVSQLSRILRTCPELPDGKPNPAPQQERERYVRSYKHTDGWMQGEFSLPPSEAAEFETAMGIARDAEFRDAQGLEVDRRARRVLTSRRVVGGCVHAAHQRGQRRPRSHVAAHRLPR